MITVSPPASDDAGLYCGGCGYDLRGSTGERCPECGLRRDGVPLALPWERRRELGRFGSFCRTAWMASLRPGRLGVLTAAGADVRSARRFRLVVLGLVWLAATTAFVGVCLHEGRGPALNLVSGPWNTNAPALFWSAGAMLWPTVPVGLAIALWLGTAWDHWFDLRSVSAAERGRAMVASRYVAAPLLGGFAVVALAGAAAAVNGDGQLVAAGTAAGGLALLGVGVEAFVILLIVTGPARLAVSVPGGGRVRAVIVLIGTVVQWALAIALGLGVFPAVVGFFWIVIDSLR